MKLHQEFTMNRPLPVVWEFFQDIPQVASCLPGAEYAGPGEGGRHLGKVSSKVGPFQASFEGEADVRFDEAVHSVRLEGKGVDRKGASRGKMVMDCRFEADGDSTKAVVDADVQLSGTIAQFGRTGLIAEIANVLVADFVRNAEARLPAPGVAASEAASATPPGPARPISGFQLLFRSLLGWLKSFGRKPA